MENADDDASDHSFNNSQVICSRSITDDDYVALDHFFIVLSIIINLLTCPGLDDPFERSHHNRIQDKTKDSDQTQHTACLFGRNRSTGGNRYPAGVYHARDHPHFTKIAFSVLQVTQSKTCCIFCLFLLSLFHLAFIAIGTFRCHEIFLTIQKHCDQIPFNSCSCIQLGLFNDKLCYLDFFKQNAYS